MQRWLIIIVFIGVAVLGFMQVYLYTPETKSAYIELAKVYDEFAMKKELESKYTAVEQARKNQLDSLEMQLKLMSEQIQGGNKDVNLLQRFEYNRQEYLAKKQQFEQDNAATSEQYNEQIGKQLNQYIKDYGKENGYTFIHGADGSGVLMYADENRNITAEVIQYINSKYKGK